MERPVVDKIFEYIVTGQLEKLDSIATPEDAIHIRTAISTDNESAAGLKVDLDEITNMAPWITPLFLGPRIFFTSASTVLQGHVNGGKSNVMLDWSFSFDSNVAEKVRAYVNHENINKADLNRVITLMRLKKEYSLQTDILPFLFENLRLSRENKKNERPLNTITAFKMLDYLDWDEFVRNPEKPKFLVNTDYLSNESKKTYESLVNSSEVKKREYKALFTQVILFELAIIWLTGKYSAENSLRKLVDFCVLQLKRLPKYELMLAWTFLNNTQNTRFFGPLNGVKKDLAKALRGMAWDISHIRTLESMATATNNGSFFIPIFVSFDDRFTELLKLNQIQVLVIDDRLQRIHSASTEEYNFQVQLKSCISDAVMPELTHKKSELRKKCEIPKTELEYILDNQTKLLEELANAERERRARKKT